jgi:addiction module HigA family antidote
MHKVNKVHPGEILKTEFLNPLGISAYRLAKDIDVPINRITEIINGHRSISTETALLLAKYFNLSDSFWIRIQARYDEVTTKERILGHLANVHPIVNIEREYSVSNG